LERSSFGLRLCGREYFAALKIQFSSMTFNI
jgi:hypothetical protein